MWERINKFNTDVLKDLSIVLGAKPIALDKKTISSSMKSGNDDTDTAE